jgi:DNA-binding transcriptional regulator YdaS (Cro superfamily)
MPTAIRTAVDKAGGARKLAAQLSVSHQAIYEWLERGWTPPKRAVQLERKTGISRYKFMKPQLAKLLNS